VEEMVLSEMRVDEHGRVSLEAGHALLALLTEDPLDASLTVCMIDLSRRAGHSVGEALPFPVS
jgi:hypothetical protein